MMSVQEREVVSIKRKDPRVKGWLLVDDPLHSFYIIVAYVIFTSVVPIWMRKRQPFQLKLLLIIYNFSMVVYSAYTVKEFLLGGWLFDYTLGCQPVDYSYSPTALRMANACWLFYISKYIELLDTVFFVLRKKSNQITFLHVFHHGCIPLFWWWGLAKVAGGFGTFHALVNACVHCVMYLYYGLAGLGPGVQKYLWWKKYVTIVQLAQFFIVTLHNSQYLFMDCDTYPWQFVAMIQGFTTLVAALFMNFYIQTYIKKSSSKKNQIPSKDFQDTNESIAKQNGEHVANSYVINGRVSGETVLKRK